MKTWKLVLPVAVALLLAGQAVAQTDEMDALSAAEEKKVQVERRLEAAEKRMAEAAREMVELTAERLPHLARLEKLIEYDNRPRLGVTIGGNEEQGPVEGASVIAVTPGTAASDAGLRAGDVLTSINNESIGGSSAAEANKKLIDFMKGVEEGDALDVEYLRNGKVGKVEVMPKVGRHYGFVFEGDGKRGFDFSRMPGVPDVHVAPHVRGPLSYSWAMSGHALGDMELVELSKGLGRYFGTDSGLLVVSAPESNKLQLQDGDVIQNIDGREPNSVRHALQILGSYEAGEKLELQIMRDKKRKKLNIEMPDDRSSMLIERLEAPVLPAKAALPAATIAVERT